MIRMRGIQEKNYTIEDVERLIKEIPWKEPYNTDIGDYQLDGIVYRVMTKKEWKQVKNGWLSGTFWSSAPLEYGLHATNDDSVMAVARATGVDRWASSGKYYNDLDKRSLEDIIGVFEWKSQGFSGEFELIYKG